MAKQKKNVHNVEEQNDLFGDVPTPDALDAVRAELKRLCAVVSAGDSDEADLFGAPVSTNKKTAKSGGVMSAARTAMVAEVARLKEILDAYDRFCASAPKPLVTAKEKEILRDLAACGAEYLGKADGGDRVVEKRFGELLSGVAALDVKARMLCELIDHHDRVYYVEGRNEIEDFQYDMLISDLRAAEKALRKAAPNHRLFGADSPLSRVGGGSMNHAGTTVQHGQRMLSIDNTYNEEELRDFDRRVRDGLTSAGEDLRDAVEYVAELKVDGVAVTLMYEKGRLAYAATRGDGREGEMVTVTLARSTCVPKELPPALAKFDKLEIRGEAYFTFNDFALINEAFEESGKAAAANPRNLVAGILKRLDEMNSASRRISVRFYAAGVAEGAELPPTHEGLLKIYGAAGLSVNEPYRLCHGIDEVLEFEREWAEKRHDLPYPVDGLVIKLNRRSLWQTLGETSKAPRYMIAYKYNTMQASTELLDVVWQVGRTGVLTPVAQLSPVQLAGTTVKRATLNNYDEIKRLGVRVGDHVLVEKSGEIIPKILRISDDYKRDGTEREIVPPPVCPECGEAVTLPEGSVSPYCLNRECVGRRCAMILYFASRGAMDIQELSEKLIRAAVTDGMIHDAGDLYFLTAEDWTRLMRKRAAAAGVKDADTNEYKLAHVVTAEIDKSRRAPLHSVLCAIGIPQVGITTARDLCRVFRTPEDLEKASVEELTRVNGVGAVTAAAITEFFKDPTNRQLMEKLRKGGLLFENTLWREPVTAGAPANEFAGKTFVLTGTLASMDRAKARERLEALGARVSSSVSAKTAGLIVGGGEESDSKKFKAAKAAGVRIINEDEFLAMLQRGES